MASAFLGGVVVPDVVSLLSSLAFFEFDAELLVLFLCLGAALFACAVWSSLALATLDFAAGAGAASSAVSTAAAFVDFLPFLGDGDAFAFTLSGFSGAFFAAAFKMLFLTAFCRLAFSLTSFFGLVDGLSPPC